MADPGHPFRCARQVAGAMLIYAALSLASRRWHRTWGATSTEVSEPLPGDALIPNADLQTTRAIEIAASPAEVWPWLVQMGQGRGGLYTYEWIEKLARGTDWQLSIASKPWCRSFMLRRPHSAPPRSSI